MNLFWPPSSYELYVCGKYAHFFYLYKVKQKCEGTSLAVHLHEDQPMGYAVVWLPSCYMMSVWRASCFFNRVNLPESLQCKYTNSQYFQSAIQAVETIGSHHKLQSWVVVTQTNSVVLMFSMPMSYDGRCRNHRELYTLIGMNSCLTPL